MIRLQKAIADLGYCSRREAEKLILENRVRVNGIVINELGSKVSESDSIMVDSKKLKRKRKEYYMLFKPRSIISSTNDEHDRTTVIDLIDTNERIYPIGRLDYDTTGLILLTNDGDFANLMMHPSSKIKKTYIAYIDGLIDANQVRELEKGVMFDDKITSKAKVKILEKDMKNANSKVQITIAEGRNHQVKKMFQAVGLNVRKLHRSTSGCVNLSGLVAGEYRKLTQQEVKDLSDLATIGYVKYNDKQR